ncbi:MAG TPA: Crp/Fnr family transcriptional regulator [bacterium]|nr:Crp/Fnr family transcriptional regulator [bacterium]
MLTYSKIRPNPMAVPGRTQAPFLDIFKSLPFAQQSELEKKMIERRFKKGDTLFLDGDPADQVWFVKEGHVKAQACSPNGRCQTLCMVGPKSMFGSCCSLGGGTYPCHSVAETDVTVLSIPRADFIGILGRHPSVTLAVADQLSQRLSRSKETQTFEQESVEKRILHVLATLADQFGNTIPLTRREIAEMAGTVVETCIRTFTKLEAAGLVACTRGRILIRDMQKIIDRMEEEDGE